MKVRVIARHIVSSLVLTPLRALSPRVLSGTPTRGRDEGARKGFSLQGP